MGELGRGRTFDCTPIDIVSEPFDQGEKQYCLSTQRIP